MLILIILICCLRYLAQGDSARSKHFEYWLEESTVHKIINETCQALWFALDQIVLKPKDRISWEQISEEFMTKWQFPNCVGALDGHHIGIQSTPNSGSAFYNYKQFFSIVLLATCDANYKFTWPLSGKDIPFPCVFVGDEAFPLNTYLMRPYSYKTRGGLIENIRIFNYRLSRCRRTIENAFGIFTACYGRSYKNLFVCFWKIVKCYSKHSYVSTIL